MSFRQYLTIIPCVVTLSACSYLPWFGQSDQESSEIVALGPPSTDRSTDYSCRAGNGEWHCAVRGSAADIAVPPASPVVTPVAAAAVHAQQEEIPPAPVAAIEVVEAAADTEVTRPSDSLRLMELPDDYYAVQLMAAPYREQALIYTENRDLQDAEIIAVATERGEWFVVIIGYEQGFEQAQQLAESYVSTHPGENPWVRKVADLKRAHLKRNPRSELSAPSPPGAS